MWEDHCSKPNHQRTLRRRGYCYFARLLLQGLNHASSIDFDLLKEHLLSLKAGLPIESPTYSFVEHNRTSETVLLKPTKVVIVEGILIFSHPDIRELFDIKIFVHADSDERLIRRIKRDISERGRDISEVLNRYQSTLKPMHQQFIEPAKEFADIIIPNNRRNTVAIDILKNLVHNRIFHP